MNTTRGHTALRCTQTFRTMFKASLILLLFTLLAQGAGYAQQAHPAQPVEPPVLPEDSLPEDNSFIQTFMTTKDTYVNAESLGTNYGSEPDLLVERRYQSPFTWNKFSFIGFDLSSLPANAVIDNAVLQVYSQINLEASPETITIVPDALLGDWDEMDVDWMNKPAQANQGDTGTVYSSGWHNINVYGIVRAWQSGTLANYGISLRLGSSELGQAVFHSRETGPTTSPRLLVTYHTVGTPAMLPVQADTFVDQSAPGTNYGSETYYRVGDGTFKRYSLLKFDLSELPQNIEVVSAHLWLYSEINKAPEGVNDIYPYLVTSNWNEMTVTWNSNVQAIYRNDPYGVYQIGWTDIEVTNIVSDWVNGTYVNNGLELRLGTGSNTAYDFFAIPAQNRAYLVIDYTDAPPPCTPISSISLTGPTSGLTDITYTFTAGITPPDATPPITYTFNATDFSPVSGTGNSIEYAWSTAGTKTVWVEAENCGGTRSTSLQIEISEPPPDCPVPLLGLEIDGPAEGLVNTDQTFHSLLNPGDATLPVTYAWQASGQTGILTDPQVTYNWSLTGTQTITLTAANCGGSFVDYHTYEVLDTADLADLLVSNAWFEPDSGRIGYLVQNIGGRDAPSGFLVEVYRDGELLGAGVFPTHIPAGAVRAGYISIDWGCAGDSGALEAHADSGGDVLEEDESNNTFTDTWTCDLTPPVITAGPTVSEISETSAVISWVTDDSTTTRLEYGWSTFSPSIIEQNVPARVHAVELTGLVPGMSYFFDLRATNLNGQLLVAPREYFRTMPPGSDPPTVTGVQLERYPLETYQFYTLRASVADPSHTQRVEFWWDGDLMGTDYSFLDGFEIYLSPHQQGWTNHDFYYSSHTIQAIAFNLESESGQMSKTVTPALMPKHVAARFISPGDGYQVYYQGSSVPAGKMYLAKIQAFTSEWKCTLTGTSEGNPGSLPGIPCAGMMNDLDSVALTLYLNGSELSSVEVVPGGQIFDVELDLEGLAEGEYQVEVSVPGSPAASRSQDLRVIRGDVPLDATRSVTRNGNYFTVQLSIKNISGLPVTLDKIADSMIAFQQVGYADENAGYTILPGGYFSSDHFVARPAFDVDYQLNPGYTFNLSYQVVPVLYESYREPRIGQLPVRVTLSDGSVSDVVVAADLVNDPESTNPIPLDEAYLRATRYSDYVLVTNPWQVDLHYGVDYDADTDKVYGAMARLARLKNGVLAFTKTYDREVLNVLLQPGSWWTEALHPLFQSTNRGYVLLVGETEVIPAFYEGTDNFVTFAGIPDWVPYSDLRYAHTSGDTARPELVVGRIPGNTPGKWLQTLQHTIDVYTGLRQWDGSAALAASGRGEGVTSIMIPTIRIVDHVMDDANIISSQLHLYDYDHDDRVMVMQSNIIGKDTLIMLGHGNPTSWNDSTFTPWNINQFQWNDIVPAVFNMSCKTGNYEDKDDDSVAEGFVNTAAGVYVGSTQNTEMWSGEWGIKKFTRHWVNNPGISFGQALNKLKSSAFSYDTGAFDHGKQLAFSYNLYGDPKFAPSPDFINYEGGPQVSLATPVLLDQALGIQELQVQLPDYTVEVREEQDFVDIPGGDWLFRDGSYIVPMVVIEQDFPAGVWVQAVRLAGMEALTTTHGLVLPRLMSLPFCEGCTSDPLPPAPEGWVPALDENYTWEQQVNPDGSSSLYVSLYPFHYNGESLDALYYQDWTFEVETIETSVAITRLQVAVGSHPLNSLVEVGLWLENSGATQDVYANLEIRRQISQELVGSLPLQHIQSLTGPASLAFAWDSAGVSAGGYYADVSLMDASGYTLAKQSLEFELGQVSAQIIDFKVSPGVYQPGRDQYFQTSVMNSGDVPLDGVAVIEVSMPGVITPTLLITHSISALAPGGTLNFADIWDAEGVTGTVFTVKAYLKYDSQTSQPWVVHLGDRYWLELPLVTK